MRIVNLYWWKMAPENNAMAPIGVKLYGWGINLLKAATKTIPVAIQRYLGVISFVFIGTKIHKLIVFVVISVSERPICQSKGMALIFSRVSSHI